ncbi:uncharacterized protein LOC126902841 [Daktulosphaira vitifoliae]|uniref:uncharacterized protein LOC126902841 n=1 Tax=Daktulosphaira vitifoliae TaxID=58002 RepID=UPI0021AAECA6|nr:uncharacterized protein LOC126902841 [Daktulosphaira vitifoliae]
MKNIINRQIILLKVIISNAIIIHPVDECNSKTDDITFITINNLKKLTREYPAFIKLTLQEHKYYTESGASLCPLPYEKENVITDPTVITFLEFHNIKFDPRKCEKPWTWTQHNECLVPIIFSTTGEKLGKIIQPCLKDNINIIQCYTLYLNVIESSSVTLVDRFCLFVIIAIDNIEQIENDESLFDLIRDTSISLLSIETTVVIEWFKLLLEYMFIAFHQYFISTLPLDCIKNVLEKYMHNNQSFNKPIENKIECRKHLLDCMKITKLKKNYVLLTDHENWNWDINSEEKPEFDLILKFSQKNNDIGLDLFKQNVINNNY